MAAPPAPSSLKHGPGRPRRGRHYDRAACATRSSRSPRRAAPCSSPTSPTSTAPCSASSTCPRRSRARCSRATRAIRGRCAASILEEFAADVPEGGRPFDGVEGERAAGPLRARLHRLRRRLDRPGRRRPRRLRVGLQRAHQDASARPAGRLPRAVDPLHPLRQADRGDRRLSLLLRRRARPRLRGRRWTSSSRSTRAASRRVQAWAAERWPRDDDQPEGAWRSSIRAKALDLLRGLLPASTLSHVGIYASGQAYEQLLLRLAASPLPEARAYGEMLLAELQRVIPSFVARVDRPDRGGDWVDHLRERREATERAVARLGLDRRDGDGVPSVELVHVDGTEDDLLARLAVSSRPAPRRRRSAAGSAPSTRSSGRS